MAEITVPKRVTSCNLQQTRNFVQNSQFLYSRVIYCANTFVQVLHVFRFINILPTQAEI